MKNDDLNLQEWYNMKQTISLLTKKCEKQKKLAEKIMREKNVNVIKQGGMKVERKILQKNVMTKKSVPNDVWNQYSTISRYDTIYLKKLKKD